MGYFCTVNWNLGSLGAWGFWGWGIGVFAGIFFSLGFVLFFFLFLLDSSWEEVFDVIRCKLFFFLSLLLLDLEGNFWEVQCCGLFWIRWNWDGVDLLVCLLAVLSMDNFFSF